MPSSAIGCGYGSGESSMVSGALLVDDLMPVWTGKGLWITMSTKLVRRLVVACLSVAVGATATGLAAGWTGVAAASVAVSALMALWLLFTAVLVRNDPPPGSPNTSAARVLDEAQGRTGDYPNSDWRRYPRRM